MNITLENKQCLIAGEGVLPVKMAQNAKENGFKVVAISLSFDNFKDLQKYCSKVFPYSPGQVDSIRKTLLDENIKQLTFLGKVSKTMLLRRPKLEPMAIELLREVPKLNDNAIMLKIIKEMENAGITILDQTIFIKSLLVQKGIMTKTKPTDAQLADIEYGYKTAKQMGELDIGQSVIMKDKMILAVEAIEGTDKCIKRGAKLARKRGAVVVKVAKPNQDRRFDIPVVGLKTLKTMKKYGANVLALESGETIMTDAFKMINYADRCGIVIMAF